MNVLLDECCPRPLRECRTGAEFFAVEMVGLKGVGNGALILPADRKFDVPITADKHLRHQQNLTGRTDAIIELPFNSWQRLRAMLPVIQAAVLSVKPGQHLEIAAPRA